MSIRAENVPSLAEPDRKDMAAGAASVSVGPYVLLRVSETGAGVPPQIIARIFEPFFTTKGPEKGMVTDVEMPFLDGVSAVRSVRKISPHLPILLATGSSRHGTEHFSQNDLAGIVRISKPYNAEQLLTEVARALHSPLRPFARLSCGPSYEWRGRKRPRRPP